MRSRVTQQPLPFGFQATPMVDAYLAGLTPAPACPKCGGERRRDQRWSQTLHVPAVSQRCPK